MMLDNPFNRLKSSEKYVYHYTKLETALNYILKTGKLRLNSFSKVNDPRESKKWSMATSIERPFNWDLKDWEALSESVSDALKQNVKLVCFCKDRASAVDKWLDGIIDRGFAKPSMWHHYANGHNGVCLIFDIEKLNASFKKKIKKEKLISKSVSYSDEGSIPSQVKDPFFIDLTQIDSKQQLVKQLETHLNQWMPSLFFKKLRDWSNEEEYRWVYFDDHAEPICLTFDDALEAVVVGEGVAKDSADFEKLLRYGKKYKAYVANLEWRNGYPLLTQLG